MARPYAIARGRCDPTARLRRFGAVPPPPTPPDLPAPRIRPAEDADVPAVLALWARARSAIAQTEDTPETIAALRALAPDALLVAEDPRTGAVVGTLVAAWDGWRGNMYRLAVLPEHRRRGIAIALVREGERRLHARGARRVNALVGREEEAAPGLWRRAGYAGDETVLRFVRNL
jgi:ribosomal protein S18 acetylase RimI-like enzyme